MSKSPALDSNIWLLSCPNTVHTILVYPLEDRSLSLYTGSSTEGSELLLYHLSDLKLLTLDLLKKVTYCTDGTHLLAESTCWLHVCIETNQLTLSKPWRLTITSTCDVYSYICAVCDVLLYSGYITLLIEYIEYKLIVKTRCKCWSWEWLKKFLSWYWTCRVLVLTWKCREILYIKLHV